MARVLISLLAAGAAGMLQTLACLGLIRAGRSTAFAFYGTAALMILVLIPISFYMCERLEAHGGTDTE